MDDEFFVLFFAAALLSLAFLGGLFLVAGSLDSTVVSNCEKNGYWQTGQTRVICSVEKKNAPST